MSFLNLGILAHVDAGKTSLTERLLYAAGIIDEVGSVDQGSTQTDTLALERQRGITIRSAVVSFAIGATSVNLIDTPGHPDFIAEVERVLSVLDGAVLVISAVEGVQPQSRVLMRALQRLRVPTLIFVNKVDRSGARDEPVLREIAQRLSPATVAMGRVDGLGTKAAAFVPYEGFHPGLLDLLAERDDALLARYVRDEAGISPAQLRAALAVQTKRAQVHPVYFGSAITGAGVDPLREGIAELLPSASGDPDGPLSGRVFKVERGPAGEKIAYVRLFSGTVRVRDRLSSKVTAISVFDQGSAVPAGAVSAGQIGQLWGLAGARIGDPVGDPPGAANGHHFAPPTLETVVIPDRPADRGALAIALGQLAEQDPLIDLRQNDARQELSVSLYGEVQKEVIQATLADEYGLGVSFRESTTICIERPAGTGEAVEFNRKEPNPFLATVGLRIEPAPVDSGVTFQLGVELGSMPYAFFKAVEDTVHQTLRRGLYGWQVTDCTVTMTHSGYSPRQSHAHQGFAKSMSSTGADFRGLTPVVLMAALRRAGTRVFEPMHRLRLEVPADTLRTVLPVLAQLRAIAHTSTAGVIEGEIPAASVYRLQQQLPALSRGEGVLESEFERYQVVPGMPYCRA